VKKREKRAKPPPPVNARRVIDGPRNDWFSAEEVAAWLQIGTSLLSELRAAGDFPPPVQLGRRRAQRWFWMDVVCWAHLRSINRESDGSSPRRRPASARGDFSPTFFRRMPPCAPQAPVSHRERRGPDFVVADAQM
jgi:predicted DNA-binding transcriptional regulator AlpA